MEEIMKKNKRKSFLYAYKTLGGGENNNSLIGAYRNPDLLRWNFGSKYPFFVRLTDI